MRICKVKLVTVHAGDQKAPFSTATTPRCRGERYSFPGLLQFTLDTYLILLSVKQGGIKYHLKVFGMTRPGIEPRSPRPLANTLPTRPMSRLHMRVYNAICNGIQNYVLTNPSARAGYDTRSIFKRSLTDLNSEFSFS